MLIFISILGYILLYYKLLKKILENFLFFPYFFVLLL